MVSKKGGGTNLLWGLCGNPHVVTHKGRGAIFVSPGASMNGHHRGGGTERAA